MSGQKPLWQSKTFWGAVIALAAYVARVKFGYDITDQEVREIADVVTDLAVAVGAGLTIYGRVAARERVKVDMSYIKLIEKVLKVWKSTK